MSFLPGNHFEQMVRCPKKLSILCKWSESIWNLVMKKCLNDCYSNRIMEWYESRKVSKGLKNIQPRNAKKILSKISFEKCYGYLDEMNYSPGSFSFKLRAVEVPLRYLVFEIIHNWFCRKFLLHVIKKNRHHRNKKNQCMYFHWNFYQKLPKADTLNKCTTRCFFVASLWSSKDENHIDIPDIWFSF